LFRQDGQSPILAQVDEFFEIEKANRMVAFTNLILVDEESPDIKG